MIVACPSCHTLYRQPPAGLAGSGDAHCSHCDQAVVLAARGRSYRLMPTTADPRPGAPPLHIGLDDPTLAQPIHAAHEAFPADTPVPPPAYSVVAEPPPVETPEAAAQESTGLPEGFQWEERGPTLPDGFEWEDRSAQACATVADDVSLSEPVPAEAVGEEVAQTAEVAEVAEVEDVVVAAALPSESEALSSRPDRTRQILMSVLLACLGGAVGYSLSQRVDVDLALWTGGGAACGLLAGWAWIRWASRKN